MSATVAVSGNGTQISVTRPAFPYPGLRPFEPEEWSIFFGRESMIDDVIERLAQQRFVLIHGASGSGKSSLVRAGVLPKLARQHLRHGAPWLTCTMRPSGGPLWNLAAELARLEGRGEDIARRGEIIRLFNQSGATLSGVIAELDGLQSKRLCLLVDQFEELFRFERESSREEAELFIDLLIGEIPQEDADEEGSLDPGPRAAPAGPAADLHIVITMRSEFLGECARFDRFAEAVNRTQYLVPRLERAALVRAIRQPARLFGGEVTADLCERLIADARGKIDELPLIQHGLMLFWHTALQAEPDAAVVLDAPMLDRAGGLAQLLSDHADEVTRKAAPDTPRVLAVERMFRALTDINAEGQAIRRPLSFTALVKLCGVQADILRGIIDAFRATGVSFLTPYAPAPITDKTIVDISHEALIRCWRAIADPRDGWLKREFDNGLVWRSLLLEAREFEENSRRVLTPATTTERQRWVAAQTAAWSERYGGEWPLVGRLLRASRKATARKRRYRRLLILFLLIFVAFGVWGSTDSYENLAYAADIFIVASAVALSFLIWFTIDLALILFDSGYRLAGGISKFTRRAMSFSSFSMLRKSRNRAGKYRPRERAIIWPILRRRWAVGVFALIVIGCYLWLAMDVAYLRGRGEDHYQKKSYPMALALYRKAAALGDAAAQSDLGWLYQNGFGVAQDYGQAMSWYRMAADLGNAVAQNNLANLYQNALGAPQDYGKAMEWYRKAADQGNASAQSNIGWLYRHGLGVPQDYGQAVSWYRLAADQGESAAQNNLGDAYQKGLGVPSDFGQAMSWYRKAADQGDTTAQVNIGWLYRNGLGVPKDYGEAMEWFRKAADHGDAAAKDNIGDLYENGLGMPPDYGQAMDWFREAADQGDAAGAVNIGWLYRNGFGVSKDYGQAMEWFLKAADRGNTGAMDYIGDLYRDGLGVQQDYGQAMSWYRKAADQGDAAAQNDIGNLYQNGVGVTQDYSQAMGWYRKAADQNNAAAQYSLGWMYDRGLGVPLDYAQALEWYRKAADQDNASAQNNIGVQYQNGSGMAKDYAQAMIWYRKAADQGLPAAMYHIATLYESGLGVPKDPQTTFDWMRKAADGGEDRAKKWLASHRPPHA
jgi:TPR repeat protein